MDLSIIMMYKVSPFIIKQINDLIIYIDIVAGYRILLACSIVIGRLHKNIYQYRVLFAKNKVISVLILSQIYSNSSRAGNVPEVLLCFPYLFIIYHITINIMIDPNIKVINVGIVHYRSYTLSFKLVKIYRIS